LALREKALPMRLLRWTSLLADESMDLAEHAARRILAAAPKATCLRTQLAILRRLATFNPANVVGVSRTIAQHCIQAERYPL